MFGWLKDLLKGIVDAIGDAFAEIGHTISETIWRTMMTWIYDTVYGAIADFFSFMGNMGAEIFSLSWIEATVHLFSLFGWALFVVGMIVAIFDFAIEYQNGRGNIKTTVLNILKGFIACSLISIVPIRLYKFCITLQNTFALDLGSLVAGEHAMSLAEQCKETLKTLFSPGDMARKTLFMLLSQIAFGYCVIKVFFQNIKRGGILLIQMSVGSLYMFSVPRGYSDGFTQWIKQVIALCLTAFLQTTLLYLGLLTFRTSMLMGLGIMLAAGEVPKIAQQFGMDTSAKFNFMSAIHATTTAINLTRMIKK